MVVDNPINLIDLMISLLRSLREMRVPLVSMATSTTHHEHNPSHLRYQMTATIKLQDRVRNIYNSIAILVPLEKYSCI